MLSMFWGKTNVVFAIYNKTKVFAIYNDICIASSAITRSRRPGDWSKRPWQLLVMKKKVYFPTDWSLVAGGWSQIVGSTKNLLVIALITFL